MLSHQQCDHSCLFMLPTSRLMVSYVTLFFQVTDPFILRARRQWQSERIFADKSFISKCTISKCCKMKFSNLLLHLALCCFSLSLSSHAESSLLSEPSSASHTTQNKPPKVAACLMSHFPWATFFHIFFKKKLVVWCLFTPMYFIVWGNSSIIINRDKGVKFKAWSKSWQTEGRSWWKSKFCH